MIKDKLKAFIAHLILSVIVVSLFIGAIIYFWYPIEYLGVTNFKDLALLIILIDLILGPLLTFVVFNPKKKSLRFDLAVIGAIQFVALAYGVNALYETHPLYITYNHKGFNVVQANEVNPENAKFDEFKISKLSSPKMAFAKMPDDPEQKMEIMLSVDLKGDPDIDKRTEFYEPYQDHLETIIENSLDATKLFAEKNLTSASKEFLKKHGNSDHYAYLPLKGVSGDAIIVLDKKLAQTITTIKANPWKFVRK